MSTVGFVAAMEQIGLADQSVAAAWQAHVTIGSLPLLLFGDDAQRERWLRPLAEGRVLGRLRPDRARRRIRRPGYPHPGGGPRRRLGHQRAQVLHLQRRDGHVLRGDPAGPDRHRKRGDGGVAALRQLRRREGHPRLHHGTEDARDRLAGPRHPRALLRRGVGARRPPRRRPGHGSHASSCARSRWAASPSPPSRSA